MNFQNVQLDDPSQNFQQIPDNIHQDRMKE
jgi:hypothetical protein